MRLNDVACSDIGVNFCFRTAVAVAGEDYCVIAADTRMSTGFSILTRDQTKLFKV